MISPEGCGARVLDNRQQVVQPVNIGGRERERERNASQKCGKGERSIDYQRR